MLAMEASAYDLPPSFDTSQSTGTDIKSSTTLTMIFSAENIAYFSNQWVSTGPLRPWRKILLSNVCAQIQSLGTLAFTLPTTSILDAGAMRAVFAIARDS